MRFVKLLKLLAPIGLAVVALGTNPEHSNGQFPGGDRGGRDRGGRGGSGGEQPQPGAIQFQLPQGGATPIGGGPPGGFGGRDRGGERGSRSFGGFGGGAPGGGFGGMPTGGMPGGGFGGGAFNSSTMADSSFARLQASYGGSGDTLDYSRIPAATREQTNAMAQRFGGEAMPASGSISKDQYRDQFAKRMEAMRGGGGRGGLSMTMSTTAPGTTGAVTFDTPGTTTPGAPQWGGSQQPQWGGSQPQWGGRGGPGGGGFDPSQVSDQQVQERFRRYDRDNDGKISAAEAQQSDRLRGVFQQYDKNADGFMDATEYKAYYVEAMSGMAGQSSMSQSWGQGQPGNWGGPEAPGGMGGIGRDGQPLEEPKPVVLRYGKLPKELPSWFETYDTNKDGQIALYEWRAERSAADFTPMDLNGDGLVTAEEYLRFKNPTAGSSASGGASPWGGGAFGARPGGTPGASPWGGGAPGAASGSSPWGGRPTSGGANGGRGSESGPTRDERKGGQDERRERGSGGSERGGNRPTGGGNPFNGRGGR